ncbi:MAG: type II toxin-antitoxin system RelE/ParE family toxin [Rhodocyclaceae bacterium]
MKPVWKIRLAVSAAQDFREIVRWTAIHFGKGQASTYARTLSSALTALTQGPDITGAKHREDIGPGIHTLHVARKGRKGRHFVVFRVGDSHNENVIDVLRLLHDSMDLPHQVTAANEPDNPA